MPRDDTSPTAYAYDPEAFTLAGLAPGTPLREDDCQRLGLTRRSVEVDPKPGGGFDTSEDWSDARDLEVAVVNGLIYLVSANDQVLIEGASAVGWTQQDFVQRIGPPDEVEELTDSVRECFWRGRSLWVFFGHGVLLDFVVREAE